MSHGIEASVTWLEGRFFADAVKASFEDFERVDVVEASYENFENVGFAAGYFLRCVSMSGSRTRFSKCSVSGSPYFVDVNSTSTKYKYR